MCLKFLIFLFLWCHNYRCIMKKAILFAFAIVLFFISCKEENCNQIANPSQPNYTPDLRGYGDYTVYEYGECDDEGNFIGPIKEVWLAYRRTLNIDGFPCNSVELQDQETRKTIPFYLLMTNKFVKMYTYCYYPVVNTEVWDQYAPTFWHTLWTRDFSKSTFDTTVPGIVPVLIEADSLIGMGFAKAMYNFHYQIEDLGEAIFNLRYRIDPIQAYGTRIRFYSSATIIDDSVKFPRFEKNFPFDTLRFNYSEFYYNNDKSAYQDKVEMKVYYVNKIGIIWLWVKHKTLSKVRTYQYWFKYNMRFSFGG